MLRGAFKWFTLQQGFVEKRQCFWFIIGHRRYNSYYNILGRKYPNYCFKNNIMCGLHLVELEAG